MEIKRESAEGRGVYNNLILINEFLYFKLPFGIQMTLNCNPRCVQAEPPI